MLKVLGIKIDKYVASEVCEDSVAVATANHDGKIVHIGDVRHITQERVCLCYFGVSTAYPCEQETNMADRLRGRLQFVFLS